MSTHNQKSQFLTYTCLLASISAVYGYEKYETFEGPSTLLLDKLQITLSEKFLVDIQSQSGAKLSGYLGWLPQGSDLTCSSCSGNQFPSKSACFQYNNNMKLTVQPDNECSGINCKDVSCHKVTWERHLTGAMDCFNLGEDLWYGGGERLVQRWPIQNDSRPWQPYITGDPAHQPNGNVLENLWITSSGFMIFVDREIPFFLSFNESNNEKICFSTSLNKYPFSGKDIKDKNLSYTICSAPNIKEAQQYAINKWLGKPTDIPDERMFLKPVWSTWARYKKDIDQKKVMEFVQEIIDNGFPNSHVEIDDMWQSCYGELEFDLNKFPDPKQMVKELNDKSFRTTLWVHPFCNINCKCFQEGRENGYFVKKSTGEPVILEWWDGTAGMIDMTNKVAVEWYVNRLESLRSKYGIDSFKFDAGEVGWLPDDDFHFDEEAAKTQPNLFTQRYNEMTSRFGGMVEIRSTWNVQELPTFVRMYDKESRWSYDNGLKTLIPTALAFSQMGYPFVLPDMVGGNNYGAVNGSLPDRELFIRWLQANTFLPSIQFSILPWEYDQEVTRISAKMVQLHETFGSYILNAARNSVHDGTPMIQPLWWYDPEDSVTWTIDTEFLLGDKMLVAPVVECWKRKRDIYLPEGRWLDMKSNAIHVGPQLLKNYKVNLEDLPFFLLQSRY